jgi:predicted transcriptional regulator
MFKRGSEDLKKKMFPWTHETENKLLELKEQGFTNKQISKILGATTPSIKKKYVRLLQSTNESKYHHPIEKTQQVEEILKEETRPLFILETHSGWGNLTRVYSNYGNVTSYEKKADRVEHVRGLNDKKVLVYKGDSEVAVHELIGKKIRFDVVDIDPYGFPSRYFPHVFNLIDKGYLFLTFPMLGINVINKTVEHHYRVWWGITKDDNKEEYLQKLLGKLKDYAGCYYHELELLDIKEIGKLYRFAFKVTKRNAFDLTGIEFRED